MQCNSWIVKNISVTCVYWTAEFTSVHVFACIKIAAPRTKLAIDTEDSVICPIILPNIGQFT